VKRFNASPERLNSRLGWTVIYLPFDASRVWGVRGQIKVRGEINGFAFRTSLFSRREKGHFLLVNKRVQKGAAAGEGAAVQVELRLDLEKRVADIPDELGRVFRSDRTLKRWYDGLNHSTRAEIGKWIMDPKSAAAQARRAQQMAERLLQVMDAERNLPPRLQAAFARDARARQGWDAMSPGRRRSHLLGIFYYRTLEGQARRIDRMLAEAGILVEKIAAKAVDKVAVETDAKKKHEA
jgi:uncharacterized protein YdeI (YjbR/CyaY-like superfamily)